MPIRALPPLLVNQIAAGEVVERPASVVKELMENAVDAGSTRLSVTIEQGGKELVCVSDDGCGIASDELPLALAPHATSKIATAEDLDAIATMGFRGEALASIASVSRMTIRSRTSASENAAEIAGEGDQLGPLRPASGPVGTTVTVRNLFFNTPARRKFLRTDQTETSRITDVVQNLALAHPSIAFLYRVDGNTRMEWPPSQSSRERVIAVLGADLAEELLELDVTDRGMRLWGMLGTPAIARPTARHQRTFLNGRLINDRTIAHAIKEAYRGLIEPNRTPTVVLFLQMDPALVDVNVHPAKAEVRFRNQTSVHGAVLSSVRARLREADLTPQFDLERTAAAEVVALPPMLPRDFGAADPAQPSSSGAGPTNREPEPSSGSFVDYFRRLDPKQKGFVYSEVKQALAQEAPELLNEPTSDDHPHAPDGAHDTNSSVNDQLLTPAQLANVLQVNSTFIVTHDEHGLLIVDQHALHERVMFEKLRKRLDQGELESQRLLMPATIDVDRAQLEALDDLRSLLARLGIEAEPMGPRTIAVQSFTTLLFERHVEPGAFVSELLTKAADGEFGGDREAALHEVLDMMACKAAIKAGDRLAPDEIAELLRSRETIERSSNCPHGRPTSLRLSIRELERQFGRR
jgi:DNA mismatch repair protein MutL